MCVCGTAPRHVWKHRLCACVRVNASLVWESPPFVERADTRNGAGSNICWYGVKRTTWVSLRSHVPRSKGRVIALQQEMFAVFGSWFIRVLLCDSACRSQGTFPYMCSRFIVLTRSSILWEVRGVVFGEWEKIPGSSWSICGGGSFLFIDFSVCWALPTPKEKYYQVQGSFVGQNVFSSISCPFLQICL